MAGGKGTRLHSLTGGAIPKPMIRILGKPLLQHQIERLKENGVTELILVIGYLGDAVRDYFGDGKAFGVSISYIVEEKPLGTAGALFYLPEKLRGGDGDSFLLLLGDVIFDIDIARMRDFHRERGALATLFAHPNSHPHDSDLIVTDEQDRVVRIVGKHAARDGWHDNCVNAGLYLLRRSVCGSVSAPVPTDLEKDVLPALIARGAAVYAYRSTEYIKDAGTADRFREVTEQLASGLAAARNLKRRQKCVFLDRDGTVNVHRGLLFKEEAFSLEGGAAEAIRRINNSGWLAIVVTNQPVVARGLCGEKDVARIHDKMKTLLGKSGAFLDRVVFCPHHPDGGYPGENPAYKISCDCRKPSTAMLERCIAELNIDAGNSWIAGDTTTDIQTGKNAGLKTALVLTGKGGRDGKYDVRPDIVCANLPEAVDRILNWDGGARDA
jgi:histidinol-phosphate phosphatase family protein